MKFIYIRLIIYKKRKKGGGKSASIRSECLNKHAINYSKEKEQLQAIQLDLCHWFIESFVLFPVANLGLTTVFLPAG